MKKGKDGRWYVYRIDELFGWRVVSDFHEDGSPWITLKIEHKSTGEQRTVQATPMAVPAATLEREGGRR